MEGKGRGREGKGKGGEGEEKEFEEGRRISTALIYTFSKN